MEQNADIGAPVVPVVENKQKSGNGLKIATAITCVVAVCGIGFGVYGMMQSSQKDNQISDLRTQIQGSDNNGDVIVDDETTTITTTSIVTPKSYGFMATNFATHFEDAIISEHTDNFGAEFSLISDGSVYLTIKGDSCKYFGNTCQENYYRNEITSLIPGRVIDISVNTYGNEGDGWAFFVLDDGTVASLGEFEASKNEQAKIVDGSKDIFRLMGGYAQNTSGKIYNISPVDSTLKQFRIDE
jgi:hypothetical protein